MELEWAVMAAVRASEDPYADQKSSGCADDAGGDDFHADAAQFLEQEGQQRQRDPVSL